MRLFAAVIRSLKVSAAYGLWLMPAFVLRAQLTYTNDHGAIIITGYTGNPGELTIPDTIGGIPVRVIGPSAFAFQHDLTGVTIPNSVTTIGKSAFQSCNNLSRLTIGNSVGNVESVAFFNCFVLRSLSIPASVTNIGGGAFFGCTALTNIDVELANPVFSSLDGVLFNKSQTELILYPISKVGDSYRVPSGVDTIGSSAFGFCFRLTSVTLPKTVTNLGSYAFFKCLGLVTVTFEGNQPLPTADLFFGTTPTVYYLPGTSGWGATFGGLPALLWNPTTVPSAPDFGVKNGKFGFNIMGTPGINVVVDRSSDPTQPVWIPVGTNFLTNGSSSFIDPQPVTNTPAFYRFRTP